MACLYQCTDLVRLKPRNKFKKGRFSTFLSVRSTCLNFGTLVQIQVKYMKSNDFLCTETCTTLYQNRVFCTEIPCFRCELLAFMTLQKKAFYDNFCAFLGVDKCLEFCIKRICTKIQKISVQNFLPSFIPLTRGKSWESENKFNALAMN